MFYQNVIIPNIRLLYFLSCCVQELQRHNKFITRNLFLFRYGKRNARKTIKLELYGLAFQADIKVLILDFFLLNVILVDGLGSLCAVEPVTDAVLQRQVDDIDVGGFFRAQSLGELVVLEIKSNRHGSFGRFQLLAVFHEGNIIEKGVVLGVGFLVLPLVQGLHISFVIIVGGIFRDQRCLQLGIVRNGFGV